MFTAIIGISISGKDSRGITRYADRPTTAMNAKRTSTLVWWSTAKLVGRNSLKRARNSGSRPDSAGTWPSDSGAPLGEFPFESGVPSEGLIIFPSPHPDNVDPVTGRHLLLADHDESLSSTQTGLDYDLVPLAGAEFDGS